MTGAVNGKALLLAEARVRQLIQARKQREAAWFVFTWRRSHLRLSNATWPPSNRWAAELAAANEMPPRTPFHIAAKSKSIRTRSARGKQRKASKAVMGGDDVSAVGSDDVAAEGNGDVAAVGDDDIVIVLLVHNRPAYLNRTLDALSKVDGIQHALLIVSHDGFYPPMHALVQSISFCRVKQLYFPFSPHLFNGSFPAASADDCRGKSRRPWETKAGGAERWEKWQRKWPRQVLCEEGTAKGGAGGLGLGHGVRDGVSEEERLGEEERVGERMSCWGQADEFGSYREPRIVSLKVRLSCYPLTSIPSTSPSLYPPFSRPRVSLLLHLSPPIDPRAAPLVVGAEHGVGRPVRDQGIQRPDALYRGGPLALAQHLYSLPPTNPLCLPPFSPRRPIFPSCLCLPHKPPPSQHHWWWVQNTVWNGLPETKAFNGHMLFIEEDHWLLRNISIPSHQPTPYASPPSPLVVQSSPPAFASHTNPLPRSTTGGGCRTRSPLVVGAEHGVERPPRDQGIQRPDALYRGGPLALAQHLYSLPPTNPLCLPPFSPRRPIFPSCLCLPHKPPPSQHHWWWVQNTVWNGLPETKAFNGQMLFIEEDHWLLRNISIPSHQPTPYASPPSPLVVQSSPPAFASHTNPLPRSTTGAPLVVGAEHGVERPPRDQGIQRPDALYRGGPLALAQHLYSLPPTNPLCLPPFSPRRPIFPSCLCLPHKPPPSQHHWWWVQNTVWNGLPETKAFNGHTLFIEEDHWLLPNALSHLRSLLSAKRRGRCNECIAVSLAPADVGVVEDEEEGAVERRGVKTAVQAQREVEDRQRGVAGARGLRLSVRRFEGNGVEKGGVLRGIGHFTAERMGNVGYSFNRSLWEMMHGLAEVRWWGMRYGGGFMVVWYVVPQVGYVVPQVGYVVPQVRYVVPQVGYVVPQVGYVVPQVGYVVPQVGYVVPQVWYVVPQVGYDPGVWDGQRGKS
ncbi:unnamed protein product [Closterium sp. Naga37s-1]|nr:unnamed protein product [Closterium sp. Naga37s-1]